MRTNILLIQAVVLSAFLVVILDAVDIKYGYDARYPPVLGVYSKNGILGDKESLSSINGARVAVLRRRYNPQIIPVPIIRNVYVPPKRVYVPSKPIYVPKQPVYIPPGKPTLKPRPIRSRPFIQGRSGGLDAVGGDGGLLGGLGGGIGSGGSGGGLLGGLGGGGLGGLGGLLSGLFGGLG